MSPGDDVKVHFRADIPAAGTIAAGARIELSARGDLTLADGFWLTGIDGGEARLVKISATGDLWRFGTINAGRVIVH